MLERDKASVRGLGEGDGPRLAAALCVELKPKCGLPALGAGGKSRYALHQVSALRPLLAALASPSVRTANVAPRYRRREFQVIFTVNSTVNSGMSFGCLSE